MGDTHTNDYVVLARKYRSRNFAELVGQDALVRTLTNAIKSNKIHHAYVFTGIRGVGKTSTARIFAKALNCTNGPAVEWDEADPQVAAITAGTHMDVLEYDAASNRGVEEVAKLFEGIGYAPVMGRYKVYIIDEVHMLSGTAFNSLLKTLEEPPPQVKFVFATTEVHKIPVTVLSRCQRFDLKRIPADVLEAHFNRILEKEGITAEAAAVQMIARAADGSARDGLSLMDQAIALSHGEGIKADVVQQMLGLADRERVYELLGNILHGDTAKALSVLDNLYAGGQDAGLVVEGLLEAVHGLTRIKVVPGLDSGSRLTELEKKLAVPLAAKVGMANLGRLYQLLVQASQEVKVAERVYEALAMALVRMAYLSPLPPMDKLLVQAEKVVKTGDSGGRLGESAGAMHVAEGIRQAVDGNAGEPVRAEVVEVKTAPAAAPKKIVVNGWKDVVKQVDGVSHSLAAMLHNHVSCVALDGTRLEIAIAKACLHEPKELVRELRMALREATGDNWDVTHVKDASAEVMTLREQRNAEHEQVKQDVVHDPAVAAAMAMFPGAEVLDVAMQDN